MPTIYIRELPSGYVDLISLIEREDCHAVDVTDIEAYENEVWQSNFKLTHTPPFESLIKCECPELRGYYEDLGYDVSYTGPNEDGRYTITVQ